MRIRIRLSFVPSPGLAVMLIVVLFGGYLIVDYMNKREGLTVVYMQVQGDLNPYKCTYNREESDAGESARAYCQGTVTNRGPAGRGYALAITYVSMLDGKVATDLQSLAYGMTTDAQPGGSQEWNMEALTKHRIRGVRLFHEMTKARCPPGARCLTEEQVRQLTSKQRVKRSRITPWRSDCTPPPSCWKRQETVTP